MPTTSTFSSMSGQTDKSSRFEQDHSAKASHPQFDQREPPDYRSSGNASFSGQLTELSRASGPSSMMPADMYGQLNPEVNLDPAHNTYPLDQSSYNQSLGAWPGFANWLWSDIDPSLDDLSGVDMELDLLNADLGEDGGANWLN